MSSRALSSADPERGATLVELLVVMAILSILAAMAIPVAETAVQRRHETALRGTLRDVRDGIDRLHDDWRRGVLSESAQGISERGYPTTLDVMIDGLDDTEGGQRRYLRSLPENPFGQDGLDGWLLLSSEDSVDAERWGGQDVFDLRPVTDREALDGSEIANW